MKGIKPKRTPESDRLRQPRRPQHHRAVAADFASLADALITPPEARRARTSMPAAASSRRCSLSDAWLQAELARRLLSLPLRRGARVAVVAEPTRTPALFRLPVRGAQPVALPASVNLGPCGYVARLRGLCGLRCRGGDGVEPVPRFLREAADGMGPPSRERPPRSTSCPNTTASLPSGPGGNGLLQYTSGAQFSARCGHHAARGLSNRRRGESRLEIKPDDCVSWLPFYHDWALWAACWRRWPPSARSTISTRATSSRCGAGSN